MSGRQVPDQIANEKQEQLSKQAVQEVGMPAITNFQEKRVLKQILELRDTKLSTVTYTQAFSRICTNSAIQSATAFPTPRSTRTRSETPATTWSIPTRSRRPIRTDSSAQLLPMERGCSASIPRRRKSRRCMSSRTS